MQYHALIISIVAGLVIELFFQLVKYKDALNKQAPVAYTTTGYGNLVPASNYMTVSQYLSVGNRRWLQYALFRLLPPAIILLLTAGVLRHYLGVINPTGYLLLAAAVSLAYRDGWGGLQDRFVSEKLLHAASAVLVLALAALLSLWAVHVDFSFLAPSISGLFDNLWSTLLVALLVLTYMRMTNMGGRQYEDEQAERNAHDNYIVRAYSTIRGRFGTAIEQACDQYACSRPIMYAVLIYENMNRPSLLRTAENTVVRLTHLTLTVGLAQVRSDKPLTDSASIARAAQLLASSTFADSGTGSGFSDIQALETVLKTYNGSSRYAASIDDIMATLRRFAPELYPTD